LSDRIIWTRATSVFMSSNLLVLYRIAGLNLLAAIIIFWNTMK
jgi:hypothetical protein